MKAIVLTVCFAVLALPLLAILHSMVFGEEHK
jgi:hypothetical protein